MTRSELILLVSEKFPEVPLKTTEAMVRDMLDMMAETLLKGFRVEIRGFGSFGLRYRAPKQGRNPKTGEKVQLSPKFVTHFKPGKDMRDRINASRLTHPIQDNSTDAEDED